VTELEHAPLTRDEAVLLTNQIQKSITLAWELIVRAYQGRAWQALGYASWDAYCRGEFGHARLALPAEERRERVMSLREHGLSTRAIAAATGVADKTVRNDLDRSGADFSAPAVTGIDGKTYSSHKDVIDAEIVEEEDGVPDSKRATRIPLPRQFARPMTDLERSARRVAELAGDDRFNKNAPLLTDLYLKRLYEAQQAVNDAVAAFENRNGATSSKK
jgi:hypothetical protein